MSEIGSSSALPSADDLQFQRAEPIGTASAGGKRCVACKMPVVDAYFHAAGQVVCPTCAERIQHGQQAPPALSLGKAALYGIGAGLAGTILYATVTIVTGLGIGLIAILVGIMVGKAIRHASGGMGGRAQQILAVAITYFSITTSYIPIVIYHSSEKAKTAAVSTTADPATSVTSVKRRSAQPVTAGAVGVSVLSLLAIAAAAPFLMLAKGTGFITVLIIFFGLRQAWALTGRSDILVMGPYQG